MQFKTKQNTDYFKCVKKVHTTLQVMLTCQACVPDLFSLLHLSVGRKLKGSDF